MEKDEIIIRNAIVHILDSLNSQLKLSESLLELSPDLFDFIRGHIYNIISSDDSKIGTLCDDSVLNSLLVPFEEKNLIETSKKIANHLYSIMNQNLSIPGADLMVVSYQYQGFVYLAILKMNYKELYSHSFEGKSNDIVKNINLPSTTTKLKEAAIINLRTKEVLLKEKKYDVNGIKTDYFSNLFLGCKASSSVKSKLNILSKAIEQINKKYYTESIEKKIETKRIIHTDLIENGHIEIDELSSSLYPNNIEVQQEFEEKIRKHMCANEVVKPVKKETLKDFERQSIITDTGFEIIIPVDQSENIQFSKTDGKINIVICNVNNISGN